ncbi:MAG: restriction endonuclease [Haloarculaceae archaeon]
MDHVIDVGQAGADAAVITDTGGGGLLGRSLLHDQPLAAYLEDDERPLYCLRNRRAGVTVERPDGTEEYAPGRGYAGLALVTDVRVLFAVGRSDGDLTLAVPLADVVDVRVEDGFLGGAFVLDTVADDRYRFPCRGELAPVREDVDHAVGVWTRAERQLDRASDALDRVRAVLGEVGSGSFGAGDGEHALTGEDSESDLPEEDAEAAMEALAAADEAIDAAREAAEPLAGAAERVGARADDLRRDREGLARQVRAERGQRLHARASDLWDEGEYEAAFDRLEDADEAYAAALATGAGEPSDDWLEERRAALADDRERLARAPVEAADHAADVAAAADDPGSAADWWETAVERYETALSLDWGEDERRFEGDPESLRADLAAAARRLVEAHCDRAREHLADGDDDRSSNPRAAATAYDLAADAIADARSVARERVPDATDEVDAVAAALADRRAALPDAGDAPDPELDGGRATASDDRSPAVAAPPSDDSATPPPVERDRAGPADSGGDGTGPEADADADADGPEGDGHPDSRTVGSEGDGHPDPRAVGPETFRSLVAELFRSAGWSTTVFASGTTRGYDLVAEAQGPVGLSLCVRTVHPDAVETVDATTVERYAETLDRIEEGDAAALVTAAPVSPAARDRATERGVELLGPDALATELDRLDVSPADL